MDSILRGFQHQGRSRKPPASSGVPLRRDRGNQHCHAYSFRGFDVRSAAAAMRAKHRARQGTNGCGDVLLLDPWCCQPQHRNAATVDPTHLRRKDVFRSSSGLNTRQFRV